MTDSGSCSDSIISIDSDVAFAFVDFSGVDFGDDDQVDEDDDEPKKTALVEKTANNVAKQQNEHLKKHPKPKVQNADHQPIVMADGQERHYLHPHDPQLFNAQERRVANLCKWYELGIRPSLKYKENLAAHRQKDDDLFASKVDDVSKLLLRSMEAQDALNANLPPHPLGEYENSLKAAPSTIAGAGNGLFATTSIPKRAIVCHYTGYRHHYHSQKRLMNRAYLLKLQNGWPKFDRRNDGFVDALPSLDVLARFINDPLIEERCNVKFEHIREPGIWHCPVVALRDIAEGEELFVSYGPRYWLE
mmetsp:Transcript_19907/g.36003  ORF Transcript_19907/g.36003 Transcript_19907/m.36003 type:complete len:304 (+) Transcript_19907:148-1059(+)